MPLTPYDRAVAAAHKREERSLALEQMRHRERLDEIDARLQNILAGARLLPGSPCDQDEINATKVSVYLSRLGYSQETTWGELCASGEFTEDQIAEIRSLLGKGKVAVVKYQPAPGKHHQGFSRVWIGRGWW